MGRVTPQGVELRHLRYFVTVAEAGKFTQAAERMFIAQPTLSQQIRRLEELVDTALLHRGREGVRLTEAGGVLLEGVPDRAVPHRSRGEPDPPGCRLGRPRLRLIMPPSLPADLAVDVASGLRGVRPRPPGSRWPGSRRRWTGSSAPVRQHRANAGLGWLSPAAGEDAAALEVMSLGEFEPDVWVRPPRGIRPDHRPGELAGLDVVHGPRRSAPSPTTRGWRSCGK